VEDAHVVLRRTGTLEDGGALTVEKRLVLPRTGSGFSVHYRLENPGPVPVTGRFGVEWNFGLLEGRSERRGTRIDGVTRRLDAETALTGVERIEVFDAERGFRFALELSEAAALWVAPVETVSLSEGGLERIVQSTALLPHWTLELAPGAVWMFGITFTGVVAA
jgi:alpha-amylase